MTARLDLDVEFLEATTLDLADLILALHDRIDLGLWLPDLTDGQVETLEELLELRAALATHDELIALGLTLGDDHTLHGFAATATPGTGRVTR